LQPAERKLLLPTSKRRTETTTITLLFTMPMVVVKDYDLPFVICSSHFISLFQTTKTAMDHRM
jgi:hypothetical protein